MGASRQRRPRPQHDPAYRALCGLLREARTLAGMTQRDLAARLTRPPSFVWKIEAAERRVDAVELLRWCRACDADPMAVFRRLVGLVR